MVPARRRRFVRGRGHRSRRPHHRDPVLRRHVEEIELDEWLEAEIETTEAPEDWTGSLDVEPEDTENEYEAEPGNAKPWADPLQFVDRGEAGGYSEVDAQDEAERY